MSLPSTLRSLRHAGRLFILAHALFASACQSAECASGQVAVDGRCVEPACETPCSTHEFCDVGVASAECRCLPGFDGTPCAFAGLIADPGFQQQVNTGAWVDARANGATVLPLEPGERDLGEGRLDATVLCSAGGLQQVVEMPPYGADEQFVVDVTYTATGVHGLAIGFDRAWKRLPPTDAQGRTERYCLGEGAYGDAPGGGPVDVQISASERLADCLGPTPAGEIHVDYFNLEMADPGECPAPGRVVNGGASLNGDDWRFLVEGDVEAGLEAGVGDEASSGARLFRAADAVGRATMSTRISVPLPGPDGPPALGFWWRGTAEHRFEVELGTLNNIDDRGRQVDTLVGTGGSRRIYCLPPWTHGGVFDLSFSIDEAVSSDPVTLIADEVVVTPDPDCTGDDLLDPGFEATDSRWFGASLRAISAAVFMQRSDALARTGAGFLDLTYWTSDAAPAMETYVLVPDGVEGAGPAVTFFSRSPSAPSNDVQWVLGRSEQVTGDVRTSDAWLPNEACLPPEWAGRWFRFQVRVEPGAGAIEQERVYLDDFALGTSASCPTP